MPLSSFRGRWTGRSAVVLSAAIVAFGAATAWAIVTELGLVGRLHPPLLEHVGQSDFTNQVKAGQGDAAFDAAFEHGDELFATKFNAVDGVGANVGDGSRFTRVPRADLAGSGQWASHTPKR